MMHLCQLMNLLRSDFGVVAYLRCGLELPRQKLGRRMHEGRLFVLGMFVFQGFSLRRGSLYPLKSSKLGGN